MKRWNNDAAYDLVWIDEIESGVFGSLRSRVMDELKKFIDKAERQGERQVWPGLSPITGQSSR